MKASNIKIALFKIVDKVYLAFVHIEIAPWKQTTLSPNSKFSQELPVTEHLAP